MTFLWKFFSRLIHIDCTETHTQLFRRHLGKVLNAPSTSSKMKIVEKMRQAPALVRWRLNVMIPVQCAAARPLLFVRLVASPPLRARIRVSSILHNYRTTMIFQTCQAFPAFSLVPFFYSILFYSLFLFVVSFSLSVCKKRKEKKRVCFITTTTAASL